MDRSDAEWGREKGGVEKLREIGRREDWEKLEQTCEGNRGKESLCIRPTPHNNVDSWP